MLKAIARRGMLATFLALAFQVHISAQTVLLIPESTTDTVQMFDPTTGMHLGVAVPPDSVNLSTPIDVAINATGILVSDQIRDAIVQFDFAGAFVAVHSSPIDNLRGIAVRSGIIYATAGNADSIPTFDLATGASLGDFIPPGGGGLASPFDILFRRSGDVLTSSSSSGNLLRYDAAGVFQGVFATGILFGEQMFEAANDNILVADFTRGAVIEYSPTGVLVQMMAGVGGCRGVYELPSGNLLVTGTGVHEVARPAGGIVATRLATGAARYIELGSLSPPPPPPSCTAAVAPGSYTGDVLVALDLVAMAGPTVDLDFEYSTDSGVTFFVATAAAASPLSSPATAVPTGMTSFIWDPVADVVGVTAIATSVVIRVTIDDSIVSTFCTSGPFDVDNTATCRMICGDCNENGSGPEILDALVAAQISAGLSTPSMSQMFCCDANSTGAIEILDALLMAQTAAGLPVTIACP